MIPGIYSLSNLQQAIATYPERWRPLVLTNGCFDLLHLGHVRNLQMAKSWGRSLIVGLNSDSSIQIIKPPLAAHLPPRPIFPEQQRAEMLAALKSVDGVVIFSDPTAIGLIEVLQPEIYVKGGDYQLETLIEASAVQAYGGKIKFVPIDLAISTTKIIKEVWEIENERVFRPEMKSDSGCFNPREYFSNLC